MPPKKPAPTAVSTRQIPDELSTVLLDLKFRAVQHIAALDQRFDRLSNELHQADQHVPKNVFVDGLVNHILDSASRRAEVKSIAHFAKGFGYLHSYAPMRKLQYRSGDGTARYEAPDVLKQPEILYHNTPAEVLIGVWPEAFRPHITAWASRLADELELPKSGTLEESIERRNAIQAELEAVDAERLLAKAQLKSLLETELAKSVPDDFARKTGVTLSRAEVDLIEFRQQNRLREIEADADDIEYLDDAEGEEADEHA